MALDRRTPLTGGKPLARKTRLSPGAAKLAPGKPLARTRPTIDPERARQRADAARERAREREAERRHAPADPRKALDAARPRKAPAATGPTHGQRVQVAQRDAGRCVRCGRPGTNVHHRRPRGMGGRADRAEANRPSLLLTVCGSGTDGCHGWIESNRAEALAAGLLLPTNGDADPRTVPVRSRLSPTGWWALTDYADRVAVPGPPSGDVTRWDA